MLFRALLAVAVMSVTAMVSARVILNVEPITGGAWDLRTGGGATVAMAPISLGNPAAAATLQVHRPNTPRDAATVKKPYNHTVRAGRGDTLTTMLVRVGIERRDAVNAITALKKHYNPRRIKTGQEITLTFQPEPDGAAPGRFLGMTLAPDFARQVKVTRGEGDAFTATEVEKTLVRSLTRAAGTIENSLFVAGDRAGLPMPILVELIRAYSWDVDFQRDIQRGDSFDVMYEQVTDKNGTVVHTGNIVFAALTLSGTRNAIYRHTTRDKHTDYFDGKGQSIRRALLRTPVDGARLSSRYGRRKHPILGYNKMHRGLDFAAPRGTPIYAAGNGTVRQAGRNGAYGKYVRIRHTGDYSTAYAHLSRFAKGIRGGKRVKQGQVIGYVGSTGRSTGPHLHYEVLKRGRQLNPLRVKMPAGRKLKGKHLKRFQTAKAEIDQRFAALGLETAIASGE
jgi:murein DD-endopeptidase MepM/ murein hydrolase activator NlpD